VRLGSITRGSRKRLAAPIHADRVLDLSAAAESAGIGVLANVTDVGSLLAAGPEAVAAARDLVAGAGAGEHVVNPDEISIEAPVQRPSKIVCVGLNYKKHAQEAGLDVPGRPILFPKWPNAVVASGTPISSLGLTAELDYEVELAVVIGKRASRVSPSRAINHVFGYTVINDVSARDLQHSCPGGQWAWGKVFDGFAPMGPWVVSADEAGDWRDLRLTARVNGELRQDELCGDMVFGVEDLIAWISQGMTLEPGDIIATGTPSGVGFGFDPPRYLVPGDRVEVSMPGAGTLVSPVVAPPGETG